MDKETITINSIGKSCSIMVNRGQKFTNRAKSLLKVYRDVVWAVNGNSCTLKEDACNSCGMELSSALVYLSDFAPEETQRDFETRVRYLFENKWMIELINRAAAKVREYHRDGELYYDIIYYSYLIKDHYKGEELSNKFGMDKSTFYRKRKEAIMLFGTVLWGYNK